MSPQARLAFSAAPGADEEIAALVADLCGGVWQENGGDLQLVIEPEALPALESRLAAAAEAGLLLAHELTLADAEPVDWAARYREGLRPIELGGGLVICPGELPAPAGSRWVVRVESTRAFGTGAHPTTRLVMRALRAHDVRGRAVLDAGCGSGVLAVAAALLGAARVFACDNNPACAEVAAETVARNQVAERVEVAQRDLGSDPIGGPYDLIVANLDWVQHPRLASRIRAALAPDGTLIASGLMWNNHAGSQAAYEALGLRTRELAYEAGWAAITLCS